MQGVALGIDTLIPTKLRYQANIAYSTRLQTDVLQEGDFKDSVKKIGTRQKLLRVGKVVSMHWAIKGAPT